MPRWSGRPWTGSGRTTTSTTSSMWSLSSTRRCASTAVNLPFFRHLLHFLLHLSTLISFFTNIIYWSTGKCYMTCNDTGYQAISFDEQTHLPKVKNENEMMFMVVIKLFFFCKRTSWGILIDMLMRRVKFSELLVPNVLYMQFSINWHLCLRYTSCAFWSMHTNEKLA